MTSNQPARERVLVTGGRGFIGRQTLGLLCRKFDQVHAVTSGRVPEAESDVCWHHADLLNPLHVDRVLARSRPTHLLHLAWITTPQLYWASSENLRWVESSLQLARGFADLGGKRFVLAGSCAEYDWNAGICSESESPLKPSTLYGASKHALRALLEPFAKERRLSFASTRTFNVYGPHERPERLVPSVAQAVLSGERARCSNGEQLRDFMHVADVARAHVELLTSDLEGPVNVASGHATAVKVVALLVAEALGRPGAVDFSPAGSPTEVPLIGADITRLQAELGFRPEYDLESGLRHTADWWKKQGSTRCTVCPAAPYVEAALPVSY